MNFKDVFFNEAKLIFSDIAIVLTIIGGVILYSFLYPQPYTSQSVSGLPLSVVDLDKSDVSRDIIFKLDATPQISVKRVDLSERDAKDALLRADVKAIVIIPNNFKKDLALNKSPIIAVGADASYFLIYGGILEGAMKSVLTQSATIKIANLLKKQVPLSKAKEAYAPYSLNIINLFNPQNSYTQYVIPAVFVLILQQTLLIGLGILGGGINEKISRGESGYFKIAPTWMMMLSRVMIFGFIFFIHMLFYFGFSFEMFDITHLASMIDLLTFGFVFLLAVIFFGIFIGALFSSREIATPAILFSSLPLVFTAGFVWPVEALPQALVYLSMLFPSTVAIEGFLKLNQMGASFDMVIELYAILWLQVIIYGTLAYLVINQKRDNIKSV
ncbi:ABC transporter permease [Sulfurimonas sp.]|uniref:ABC transporter permease n=1 Tax=Sulfurimonas sp. TaxID=2022749 RepID=UPI002AB3017B|nr:ABC transporter permease [Sulfurimonas sp.]